jgi:hypothetical protein
MVDSLEAAVRFRLPDVDEEEVTNLKTFAVLLGSRDAINFAAMVLYSLLGLVPARVDLQNFVGDQLGDHPIAKLLIRCTNPPPPNETQLALGAAFQSLFRGSSAS